MTERCKKDDSLVYGTMTDQEGNIYRTITIGTQTWMAENLRTTTYRNGEPIIKVVYSSLDWWQNGGYWDYHNRVTDNDNLSNISILFTDRR